MCNEALSINPLAQGFSAEGKFIPCG